MNKIQKIYISCCKTDLHLLKICVASIRFWYPNIPIFLIKDISKGYFNTTEIEKNFNVDILTTQRKKLGWGFPKFEAIFLKNNDRIMTIDSDIVFIGKVIEPLNDFSEDFILHGYKKNNPNEKWVKENYYDFDKIKKIDKHFIFPGFLFNSGQIVTTCGKISYEDFDKFVTWSEPPILKYPEIFSCGDQGLLNYVLAKKYQNKEISIGLSKFMFWRGDKECDDFDLEKIKDGTGYPYIIHWAGEKPILIKNMERSDILKFYENFYYSKIHLGIFKKNIKMIKTYLRYLISKNFILRIIDKNIRKTKERTRKIHN